ncbi:MAG: branched-chain amino acid ABC transporter permease [Candidatus Bathyarchaeia archaeon]
MKQSLMSINRNRNRNVLLCLLIIIVVLFLVPFIGLGEYLTTFLILFLTFLTMAELWNFLAGYCGLFSLGQGAYVGLAGYMLGVLTDFGWQVHLAIITAGIVSAIFAAVVSKPLFRIKGVYFSIGTLALTEMLRIFFTSWRPPWASPVTWGGAGIPIKAATYISRMEIYYLALIIALLAIFSIKIILNSKLGLNIIAICDDEDAALSCGIPTYRYKLYSFVICCFFTGLAGATFYLYQGYIEPQSGFGIAWTLIPLMATIIGGLRSIEGPVVGAIIVTILYLQLVRFMGLSLIVQGIIVLIIVFVAPRGLKGIFKTIAEHTAKSK